MNLARLAVLGFVAAAIFPAAGASAHESVLVCTNLSSGTNWRIKIDYRRGTVDSQPAQIGSKEISWFDKNDGGTYTLNRQSGELEFVAPSSTGGYFVHDHCAVSKTAGVD